MNAIIQRTLYNNPKKDQLVEKLSKQCPYLVKALSGQYDVKFAQFKEGQYKGSSFCMMIETDFSDGIIPAVTNTKVQARTIEHINCSLSILKSKTIARIKDG